MSIIEFEIQVVLNLFYSNSKIIGTYTRANKSMKHMHTDHENRGVGGLGGRGSFCVFAGGGEGGGSMPIFRKLTWNQFNKIEFLRGEGGGGSGSDPIPLDIKWWKSKYWKNWTVLLTFSWICFDSNNND